MDVSAVRAHIKSWERDFKAEHGRGPSVQDIKEQPAIAEKYKIYKKLSKAAAQPQPNPQDDSPSTPPRSAKRDTRPSLLLSRPRVVDTTTASIQSQNNPFSPVKGKGKQRDAPSAFRSQQQSSKSFRHNPFATPSKTPKSKRDVIDDGSSDDMPAIIPFQNIASTSAEAGSPTGQAVSRARKRLRGELVSPSPNKEKRRRTGPMLHEPMAFAKFGSPMPISDDEDSFDADTGPNASFFDDSPVKAPTGGKSFKLLFAEVLPKMGALATVTKGKGSLSRSKTISATSGLFGDRIDRTAGPIKGDVDRDPGMNATKRRLVSKSLATIPARSMSHDDPLSGGDDDFQNSSAELPPYPPTSATNSRHSSRKRSLSNSDVDSNEEKKVPARTAPQLIPPSPPLANTSQASFKSTLKGKGKAPVAPAKSRKKAKIQKGADEMEDEEESSDVIPVKVVTRHGKYRAQRMATDDNPNLEFDYDSDNIMAHSTAHRGSREPNAMHSSSQPGIMGDLQVESGRFDVDLPDKLRQLLAISPSTHRDSREERVVRGLLSGRRATHYDPSKGGEIWDVGEDDGEMHGDTEGEDDWEGPGVPWEAAEL
ncbi:hypothetical protein FIBSPDRAFT_883424 [Athelia psychrophila]|uniref:DNA replication regulator SLD2 n=1 Tax=Athelia psychrophila TaxID=1759441 RepID=A0A166TZ68_9AGAM|nr:hypothetical protein FIBSPDRAFT_883424 [Fibularhizoctonia sp. CBS 109695]